MAFEKTQARHVVKIIWSPPESCEPECEDEILWELLGESLDTLRDFFFPKINHNRCPTYLNRWGNEVSLSNIRLSLSLSFQTQRHGT